MGQTYDRIDDKIAAWVQKQKMFFVASAPLSGDGLVNCSPKGGDTLRILDDRTLIYLEYAGSGVETIAHIRENGRMVIMLCAFEGPPKIFRFHGHGEAIGRDNPEFDILVKHYDQDLRGIRSIIKLTADRISDSCGYGVPVYDYQGDRPSTQNFLDQTDDTMLRTGLAGNLKSLDGLPGITNDEIIAMTPEADPDTKAGNAELEPLPE